MSERVSVNGILLLDKPRGFTSNQCLQQVKRLFNARKAGHTGTLDPIATGLLPIVLGEATKFAEYAHEAAKTYCATGIFGEQRDTGDGLGKVVAEAPVPELTEPTVRQVLQQFTGTIKQVPPMYSALRHQGERLYDLARKGIDVARLAREVTIYRLELLKLTTSSLEISVSCSKGTYIRTLIEDIATALGTKAYMSELCRTESAGFTLDEAISLAALKELPSVQRQQQLLPADRFLSDSLPSLQLTTAQLRTLYFGQPLQHQGATVGLAKIYCDDYGFCGLVQSTQAGELRGKKLFGRPEGL